MLSASKAVSESSSIVWDIIAFKVGNHTAKQCRECWLVKLNPEVRPLLRNGKMNWSNLSDCGLEINGQSSHNGCLDELRVQSRIDRIVCWDFNRWSRDWEEWRRYRRIKKVKRERRLDK
jgi:hypothetical protein